MINYFLSYLMLIFPSYWVMLEDSDYLWDVELNRLMKNNKFEYINTCKASLGGHTIWIANYPYSCFKRANKPFSRPYRWTIYKARKKLYKDTISQ